MITNIIPTYNSLQKLSIHLTMLNMQTLPADQFEVIVVSDEENSEVKAMCNALETKYDLRYYDHPHRGYGLCWARNEGARQARYDILVFTDDDTIPIPSYLQRFSESIEPGTYVVGADYVLNVLGFKDRAWIHAGSSWGIMKDDFVAAGMYDENLREYGFEESDMGLRLYLNGMKWKYDRNIQSTHLNRLTAGKRKDEALRNYEYLRKKYEAQGINVEDEIPPLRI